MKKYSLMVIVTLFAPTLVLAATVFTDVPAGAWFSATVERAATLGIVKGYADAKGNSLGRFGPTDPVTMGQGLKIAVEAAGYDVNAYASSEFDGDPAWVRPYMGVAIAENIFPFGCLVCREINEPARREDIATILADAFKVEGREKGAMEVLIRDGIIKGDTTPDGRPTGNFRPEDNINRAEASAMALRAMDKYGRRDRGSTLTSAEAIARVRALPEVQRWLATPSDEPLCNDRDVVGSETVDDQGFFTVELITHCTNHNSASGWYRVNAITGDIRLLDS